MSRIKTPTRRRVPLQLLVGVCSTHGWGGGDDKGQAQERTESETGELQVTSKVRIMRESQHPWARVWLCPFATDRGSLLELFQRGASVSSLMAARLYSVAPNTSWQQHLHHYWFPFLLCLEKHGSHARRRHRCKVRLPPLLNSIIEMQRKRRREFRNGPNLE